MSVRIQTYKKGIGNRGIGKNIVGMTWNNEGCPASFRALARPQLRRGIFLADNLRHNERNVLAVAY